MVTDSSTFEDSSIIFNNDHRPMSLVQRLGYARRLVFSKTKLEFRLLWNKIFHKNDDELSWLLSPYKKTKGQKVEATMMASFNKNSDFSYDSAKGALGHEKVTIYNRSMVKKNSQKKKEKKTIAAKALQIARYMGMGVYMTSTSFPSPFLPVNDTYLYDETVYDPQNAFHVCPT